MKTNTILQGDCIEKLKELPDNSVDAIVTDPPYGLEFMGKEWDKFNNENQRFGGGGGAVNDGGKTLFGRLTNKANSVYQYNLEQKNQFQQFCTDWATECLRVLKHGGFLLSFGGTRTYHRMVCGIEDAGFEIRDCIMWLYGSGFPKSLNIGKQIDKIQGNEREEWIEKRNGGGLVKGQAYEGGFQQPQGQRLASKGSSEWEGWGTALKPACEPIVVARKPLSEKNVALNVLKWGTGGINIDACRVGTEERTYKGMSKNIPEGAGTFRDDDWKPKDIEVSVQGRFPANIILDEEAGEMLDEQSGISKSNPDYNRFVNHQQKRKDLGYGFGEKMKTLVGFNDKGGASRFFYCAKASKSERNYGCEELEDKIDCDRNPELNSANVPMNRSNNLKKNNHPTIKPIKLIEYLVKLVSREGAIVLDCFMGSGTTAIACLKQNRKYIGIEKEKEYIEIAEARIKPYLEQSKITI